jgi:outer membrane protein OmpA-like peptidoglycan-associated protein
LTVTITATNKVYDGTTNATVSYADDRISGDQLTVSGTPTFGSKAVGNAKTVTANSIAISGTDAANYTHNTTATTTANITPRTLTVTITATNKVYDGTTSASVVYSDNRVSGDQLTASGTPVFSDKNVAASKLITASSIAISGTDAANYTHNTTATTAANITRRPLSVVAIANDKTYDATNVATVSYTDNRLDGDVFTISSTALFDDAELGRDKPVSITNITLAGTDASNYQPNSSATSTGDITVREISASIPAVVSNAPLSDSTPTVHIGDLVPSVDTTVTFTRPGFTSVVCSMIPQHVTDTCTATALTDGVWTYRARQLVAGLMVAASEQLTITIDTVAPSVTKAATFVASSDTGASATDGITSDATPTVSIADASATDRVVVTATFSGQTIQCSFTATASDRTCTLPALTDGAWSITAVITDSANNVSSPTPPMVATIDTVIPAASAAPFNAQDNGATTSLDATPRISITGVNAGDIATVNGLSSKAEKASCSFTASSTTSFCEMSTMPSGTWSLTATVTDLAGNTSPPSPPTQLIISAGLAPVTVARSAVVPSPSVNRRENVVAVKFGAPAAIAGVQSVSFIVLDGSGKVVRRATIKVKPTDTGARIVVPASVKGARVRVITTNQCGVSDGAPRSFNVRPGKTSISVDPRTNAPSLAGQLVLPQIDFGPSEITLDATDRAQLDKVAKDMDGKCGTLLVSGFSRFNNTDSRRYLQNLADFRAKAVADYLSSKGLTMWISYKGFVIRSNDNAASANRRVALYWTPA